MSSFLSLYFFHFVSKGLASTDLEDLLEDIKVYMELEQGRNVEFWKVKITAGWPKQKVSGYSVSYSQLTISLPCFSAPN